MASIYEEIEIEDMKFNEEEEIYTYPCPCGDKYDIIFNEILTIIIIIIILGFLYHYKIFMMVKILLHVLVVLYE